MFVSVLGLVGDAGRKLISAVPHSYTSMALLQHGVRQTARRNVGLKLRADAQDEPGEAHEQSYPGVKLIEDNIENCLAVLPFPSSHR